eukprot:g3772.t1
MGTTATKEQKDNESASSTVSSDVHEGGICDDSLDEAKALLARTDLQHETPLPPLYAELIDVVSRSRPETVAALVKIARRDMKKLDDIIRLVADNNSAMTSLSVHEALQVGEKEQAIWCAERILALAAAMRYSHRSAQVPANVALRELDLSHCTDICNAWAMPSYFMHDYENTSALGSTVKVHMRLPSDMDPRPYSGTVVRNRGRKNTVTVFLEQDGRIVTGMPLSKMAMENPSSVNLFDEVMVPSEARPMKRSQSLFIRRVMTAPIQLSASSFAKKGEVIGKVYLDLHVAAGKASVAEMAEVILDASRPQGRRYPCDRAFVTSITGKHANAVLWLRLNVQGGDTFNEKRTVVEKIMVEAYSSRRGSHVRSKEEMLRADSTAEEALNTALSQRFPKCECSTRIVRDQSDFHDIPILDAAKCAARCRFGGGGRDPWIDYLSEAFYRREAEVLAHVPSSQVRAEDGNLRGTILTQDSRSKTYSVQYENGDTEFNIERNHLVTAEPRAVSGMAYFNQSEPRQIILEGQLNMLPGEKVLQLVQVERAPGRSAPSDKTIVSATLKGVFGNLLTGCINVEEDLTKHFQTGSLRVMPRLAHGAAVSVTDAKHASRKGIVHRRYDNSYCVQYSSSRTKTLEICGLSRENIWLPESSEMMLAMSDAVRYPPEPFKLKDRVLVRHKEDGTVMHASITDIRRRATDDAHDPHHHAWEYRVSPHPAIRQSDPAAWYQRGSDLNAFHPIPDVEHLSDMGISNLSVEFQCQELIEEDGSVNVSALQRWEALREMFSCSFISGNLFSHDGVISEVRPNGEFACTVGMDRRTIVLKRRKIWILDHEGGSDMPSPGTLVLYRLMKSSIVMAEVLSRSTNSTETQAIDLLLFPDSALVGHIVSIVQPNLLEVAVDGTSETFPKVYLKSVRVLGGGSATIGSTVVWAPHSSLRNFVRITSVPVNKVQSMEQIMPKRGSRANLSLGDAGQRYVKGTLKQCNVPLESREKFLDSTGATAPAIDYDIKLDTGAIMPHCSGQELLAVLSGHPCYAKNLGTADEGESREGTIMEVSHSLDFSSHQWHTHCQIELDRVRGTNIVMCSCEDDAFQKRMLERLAAAPLSLITEDESGTGADSSNPFFDSHFQLSCGGYLSSAVPVDLDIFGFTTSDGLSRLDGSLDFLCGDVCIVPVAANSVASATLARRLVRRFHVAAGHQKVDDGSGKSVWIKEDMPERVVQDIFLIWHPEQLWEALSVQFLNALYGTQNCSTFYDSSNARVECDERYFLQPGRLWKLIVDAVRHGERVTIPFLKAVPLGSQLLRKQGSLLRLGSTVWVRRSEKAVVLAVNDGKFGVRLTDVDGTLLSLDLHRRASSERTTSGLRELALQSRACIRSLDLSHINLGSDGAEAFSGPLLSQFPSDHRLCEEKYKHFSTLLAPVHGIASVQNAYFRRVQPVIQTLRLSSCHLGGGNGILILSRALRSNRSLRTLDLSRNRIGDVGARALSEDVMRVHPHLRSLNLAENCLTKAGGFAIAAGLAQRHIGVVVGTQRTVDLVLNATGERLAAVPFSSIAISPGYSAYFSREPSRPRIHRGRVIGIEAGVVTDEPRVRIKPLQPLTKTGSKEANEPSEDDSFLIPRSFVSIPVTELWKGRTIRVMVRKALKATVVGTAGDDAFYVQYETVRRIDESLLVTVHAKARRSSTGRGSPSRLSPSPIALWYREPLTGKRIDVTRIVRHNFDGTINVGIAGERARIEQRHLLCAADKSPYTIAHYNQGYFFVDVAHNTLEATIIACRDAYHVKLLDRDVLGENYCAPASLCFLSQVSASGGNGCIEELVPRSRLQPLFGWYVDVGVAVEVQMRTTLSRLEEIILDDNTGLVDRNLGVSSSIDALVALSHASAGRRTMRVLSLNGVPMGDLGAYNIARAFAHRHNRSSVEDLRLARCEIGIEGQRSLLAMLGVNTKLDRVLLTGNLFNAEEIAERRFSFHTLQEYQDWAKRARCRESSTFPWKDEREGQAMLSNHVFLQSCLRSIVNDEVETGPAILSGQKDVEVIVTGGSLGGEFGPSGQDNCGCTLFEYNMTTCDQPKFGPDIVPRVSKLITIGDKNVENLPFPQIIQMLRSRPSPCSLSFRKPFPRREKLSWHERSHFHTGERPAQTFGLLCLGMSLRPQRFRTIDAQNLNSLERFFHHEQFESSCLKERSDAGNMEDSEDPYVHKNVLEVRRSFIAGCKEEQVDELKKVLAEFDGIASVRWEYHSGWLLYKMSRLLPPSSTGRKGILFRALLVPYISTGLICNEEQLKAALHFLAEHRYGIGRASKVFTVNDFECACGISAASVRMAVKTMANATAASARSGDQATSGAFGKLSFRDLQAFVSRNRPGKIHVSALQPLPEHDAKFDHAVGPKPLGKEKNMWLDVHAYQSEQEAQLARVYQSGLDDYSAFKSGNDGISGPASISDAISDKYSARQLPFRQGSSLWEREVIGAGMYEFLKGHELVSPQAKTYLRTILHAQGETFGDMRARRGLLGEVVWGSVPSEQWAGMSRMTVG